MVTITREPGLGRFFEWKKTNPILVWRKQRGLTRADAGLLVGVSATTIQSWETGATMPSRVNTANIARTMEITDDQFTKEYDGWLSKVGRRL
jgi:DNA-binding XRE family transcriptional regulator